jgi:hypothetical protein
MPANNLEFFPSALTAGAILTGFCGTFLSFRIQREANYHRQPVLSFDEAKAKDIFIDLSHFSSSFLMLILASLVTMASGFVLPLLRMAGLGENWIRPGIVAGGLLSGLVLICGYFCIELVHYNIISNRLMDDRAEWGTQTKWIVLWAIGAICTFLAICVIA